MPGCAPPCIRLLPCWWQESQERSAHVGGHDECVYWWVWVWVWVWCGELEWGGLVDAWLWKMAKSKMPQRGLNKCILKHGSPIL